MKEIAFVFACSALGCGAPQPAPPSGGAEASSSAAARPDDGAAPPATSLPIANASAAPSASAAAATATAPPAAKSEPPPLSPEEQKKLEKTCKPLVAAMQRATQKAKPGTNPLSLLAELMKKPPAMAEADRATCSAFLERSIRDYLAAAIETEARVMLKQIAFGMISAFEDKHAFCPATTTPIPASAEGLSNAPYVSSAADWATPSWQCLHFDIAGQAQRFQYAVKTDPGGVWFEAIARGAPRGDGKLVEIVQRGEVRGDKLALLPVARR